MKRKILSLFICSMMLVGSVCGCESKNESVNDNSVNTEATVMPNEVKAKVKEAAFMESVPIPENGWTDETLLDTIRINGEKVEFPFCLNDLGDGFVPVKDKWQYIKDGEGKSNVEYYQNNFCMITTYNTSDLSNIANDEIKKFQIWIDDDNIVKGDYPISINGVTIGSDYDEIYEKLGFEATGAGIPDSSTKGVFTVVGYTDNYRVLFQGANLKVKHINILNQK